ncbi:MAG: hypothetical protein R3C49_03505 [Planctomycetaceae bacterium]
MPRLNFTGRKRISHDHVRISVTADNGQYSFSARMNLESYRFPESAAVIVEAYRQLELLRFEFGSVVRPIPPPNCRLTEFGSLDGVRFRVKVVSTDAPRGQLLAVADRITATDEALGRVRRIPLINVKGHDLGREIWKLDLTDEPLLLINYRMANKHSLVRSPMFQSLVLPSVLRTILTRVLLIDGYRQFEDDDDWAARWLRFAASFPGVGEVPEDEDPEMDAEWIEGAVSAFCLWRGVDRLFREFWRDAEAGA